VVKLEPILRRALIVLAALTAVATGLPVVRILRARQFARTFTTYGKLPEIPIALSEYIVLGAAIVLLLGGLLELIRIRAGAPLALAATASQWVLYGPALRAHLAGDGWFEPVAGSATVMPWQQFAWLIAAMLCAALLCLVRHRARPTGG
jgi:hypothetical protein